MNVARLKKKEERIFIALFLMTTLIALIPIGFADYNTVTHLQRQGLLFKLLSLAILIVTNGGVLVLTLVIKPAIVGASGYGGAQLLKKAWERWNGRKDKATP
jgi:hypothetical protein